MKKAEIVHINFFFSDIYGSCSCHCLFNIPGDEEGLYIDSPKEKAWWLSITGWLSYCEIYGFSIRMSVQLVDTATQVSSKQAV